jgi:L-seryl-tRNA(Ser) seleniumtransferase
VPRTDAVLADPRLVAAVRRLGRARVKAAVAAAQQQAREGRIPPAEVAAAAAAALPAHAATLTPVLNATGVLLHTNLGRAPLSAAARAAVAAAAGCTDLEFDLATGARGQRGRGALAGGGGEIVVSRGELIEIGDRFRLPDLLESTGARIREVGTTNRTTPADYAAAVGPATAFVLKVHPSNYRIEGFTASASVADLAGLPVPVVGDIGSGLLAPSPLLPDEPDADTWLRAGAALVTASGDKLLGGPQAGLLLGRADLVTRLARHPLARALRVGKLTFAALEATLAGPPVPVAEALAVPGAAVFDRAERLAAQLCAAGVDARAGHTQATAGGGAAPGVALPSAAVSLPGELAAPLRAGEPVRSGAVPAVAGRTEGGRILLDLRSVAPSDDDTLAAAVLAAVAVMARRSAGPAG